MRPRAVVALFLLLVTAFAGVLACGLDENGLLPPDASITGKDGGGNDVIVSFDAPLDVPQACSTLDAAACYDGTLPAEWTFFVVGPGQTACPGAPGDFSQQFYVTSPQAEAGACTCSPCTTTGTYTCAGSVNTGSQSGSCNGVTATFDAGDTPGCFLTAKVDPNLSVGPPPMPSGAVTCDASVVVNQVWSATDVTACTPTCSADYCGLQAPFLRCVASNVATACPAPFTQQRRVGPASAVNVTCGACGCAVNTPPRCSATAEAFKGADCDGGSLGTIPADGGCNPLGGGNNAASFVYTPTIPTPSCAPTSSASASATLAQFITVCCLP